MCFDPISLAVMAASAAVSGGAGIMAGKDKEDADAKRQIAQLQYDTETARRNAEKARLANQELAVYQDRNTEDLTTNKDALTRALYPYAPGAQGVAQAGHMDARTELLNNSLASGSGMPAVPYRASAPAIVGDTLDRKVREARKTARDMGMATHDLSSFMDTFMGNQRAAAIGGKDIRNTNAVNQARTATLPAAQQFAQFPVDTPRLTPRNEIASVNPLYTLAQTGASIAGAAAGGGKLAPGSTAGNWLSSFGSTPSASVYPTITQGPFTLTG